MQWTFHAISQKYFGKNLEPRKLIKALVSEIKFHYLTRKVANENDAFFKRTVSARQDCDITSDVNIGSFSQITVKNSVLCL